MSTWSACSCKSSIQRLSYAVSTWPCGAIPNFSVPSLSVWLLSIGTAANSKALLALAGHGLPKPYGLRLAHVQARTTNLFVGSNLLHLYPALSTNFVVSLLWLERKYVHLLMVSRDEI
eukprot:6212092-Pleurochrysis_carterae.AAC.1